MRRARPRLQPAGRSRRSSPGLRAAQLLGSQGIGRKGRRAPENKAAPRFWTGRLAAPLDRPESSSTSVLVSPVILLSADRERERSLTGEPVPKGNQSRFGTLGAREPPLTPRSQQCRSERSRMSPPRRSCDARWLFSRYTAGENGAPWSSCARRRGGGRARTSWRRPGQSPCNPADPHPA